MRIWALVDDKPGNRTQSIGVAERLSAGQPGSLLEIKQLQPGLFSRLPNALLGDSLRGYDSIGRNALLEALKEGNGPDVVIAAGRRLVPALRYVKRHHPKTISVYIMHPQVALTNFDLIAMPEHDEPPKMKNIFPTVGAPHRMTTLRAWEAADAEKARFANLPHPRIALLAGGNAGDCRWKTSDWQKLAQAVRALAERSSAHVMVTTSRRTGDRGTQALMQSLPEDAFFHRWQPEGDNPYAAMLGSADAIVVTGESMSMLSEACSLGKPVFFYVPEDGVEAKHARFHDSLVKSGHAQKLDAGSSLRWAPSAPLDEAGRVAEAILRKYRPEIDA